MTHDAIIRKGALGVAIAVALSAAPALAETTLWLVRPLYPGQEALVERTEKALDKLMPGPARKDAVIGLKELGKALEGKRAEQVPCLSSDERCLDPTDAFVASLGFDRVVLIYGGQDEAGFKFRVAAYEPKTGKVTPASATAAALEKALLGAVAKVVPAASTLEVKSTPSGATVYIDGEKAGTTPLSTQVLPGERVVRIDLKLHQPVEETVVIPIRGAAVVEKALAKVAARILVTALPAGTTISIDGVVAGKDRVDRGIDPGKHVIRCTADEHKAFEQTIEVKPDDTVPINVSLESIAPKATPPDKPTIIIVEKDKPPDGKPSPDVKVPPPFVPMQAVPKTITEQNLDRKSYFHLGFEWARLEKDRLVGRRWGDNGFGRTDRILTPGRVLMGGSMEYGTYGKYFGLAVVGLSYLTNSDVWGMHIGHIGATQELDSNNNPKTDQIDSVRVHMVNIRALQPQVRFVIGRFQLGLQAGLAFRTGQIYGVSDTTSYPDGFMLMDLLAEGRLNARFYVADGFYLQGSANYSFYLTGETTSENDRSAGQWGFNAGVGYGF